jgi:hypothetical protein
MDADQSLFKRESEPRAEHAQSATTPILVTGTTRTNGIYRGSFLFEARRSVSESLHTVSIQRLPYANVFITASNCVRCDFEC